MSMSFGLVGPVEIQTWSDGGAQQIGKEQIAAFWESTLEEIEGGLAERNGCYIFGLKNGANIWPYYVGKTWKGFKNEIFNPFQKLKYLEVIHFKGRPVFYFVYKKQNRKIESKIGKDFIKRLESYLIQTAVSRNPDLLNIQNTKEEKWSIEGVLRDGIVGKKPAKVTTFKKMMGI